MYTCNNKDNIDSDNGHSTTDNRENDVSDDPNDTAKTHKTKHITIYIYIYIDTHACASDILTQPATLDSLGCPQLAGDSLAVCAAGSLMPTEPNTTPSHTAPNQDQTRLNEG